MHLILSVILSQISTYQSNLFPCHHLADIPKYHIIPKYRIPYSGKVWQKESLVN